MTKKINYGVVIRHKGVAYQVRVEGEALDNNAAVRKDATSKSWVLDNPSSGMLVKGGFKSRKAAVEFYDENMKKKLAEIVAGGEFAGKVEFKKGLPVAFVGSDGDIVVPTEAKPVTDEPTASETPSADKPKKCDKAATTDEPNAGDNSKTGDNGKVPFAYQVIVERVLESLNKGVIPWEQPFFGQRKPAYNRASKKPYILINQFLLKHGGEYASFKQWKEAGAKIRKGEKGEWVFGWCPGKNKKDEDGNPVLDEDGNPVMEYPPRAIAYKVWHISKVEDKDGNPFPATSEDEEPTCILDIEETDLERMLMRYCDNEGIKVTYDNDKCAGSYLLDSDSISLWKREQFKGVSEFLSTFAHESGHSTGAKKRLNRNIGNKFGSRDYAKEELVAELTAAFLLNKFEIGTERSEENNVAYCQNWAGVLKNDPKLIVQAAARAQKALAYIVEKAGVAEDAPEVDEPTGVPTTGLVNVMEMPGADHGIVDMIANVCKLTTEWRGHAVYIYGEEADNKVFEGKLRGLVAVKEAA